LGSHRSRNNFDLGGDRQVGYTNSVLVHVTNTARMDVPEALMPNGEGLTGQGDDLPSNILTESSRMDTGVAKST
jgi:hypothetical protein